MSKNMYATILYVGTDLDEGKLVEFILQSERHDRVVASAPNIQRVQFVVKHKRIDLVLLDFRIEGGSLNAFLLYQQLRSIPSLHEVPILFWRVPNLGLTYTEAQRLGAAGCISLVFQPQDLLAARDTVLKGGTYYPPIGSVHISSFQK